MTDKERHLEELLRQLPDHMAFPPTPDIAAQITNHLPGQRPKSRLRHPIIWATAAVAIAAILLVAALPGPRNAVAEWLGLPGIKIEIVDRHAAQDEPVSIGSSLLFGELSSLEDAQKALPFTMLIPNRDDLRQPTEVWLRQNDQVVAVSLIYTAHDALPEIDETDVGMLLMEFRTSDAAPFIAKQSMGNGSLERVLVHGKEAWWVSNGALVLQPDDSLLDLDNGAYQRRSGNVLIWSDGVTTFRLETSLDRESAVHIAESLEPFDPD